MVNIEETSSKRSIGEAGEEDQPYREETKQERLDRFSAAAWHQSNGGEGIPEELRKTQMSSANVSRAQSRGQDVIEPQQRPQRLHASSMATVTGSARDRQLEE